MPINSRVQILIHDPVSFQHYKYPYRRKHHVCCKAGSYGQIDKICTFTA